MALSGIAMQHVHDGYSRHRNFGGSLVCSMVVIKSPNATNIANIDEKLVMVWKTS